MRQREGKERGGALSSSRFVRAAARGGGGRRKEEESEREKPCGCSQEEIQREKKR